jgi:hypothetical protein
MKHIKLFEQFRLNEQAIDFTNQEQFSDFLQNKTKELEGKKVKLNVFDTFANGDTEKQKFVGDIIVNIEKRTGGTGNLKYDATLVDDGGYKYISPLKGKKMQITIPSTTGGQGGFGDENDDTQGIRGLFKVKTLEII